MGDPKAPAEDTPGFPFPDDMVDTGGGVSMIEVSTVRRVYRVKIQDLMK
jgi:hypothetical protein